MPTDDTAIPVRLGVSRLIVDDWRERLLEAAPRAELIVLEPDGAWAGEPAGLDAFFLSEDLYEQPEALQGLVAVLRDAPPRWMQTASTGVDHVVYTLVLRAGGTLTNLPGVHAGPIAEYVFAHILSRAKRLPEHAAQAQESVWRGLTSVELAGQTIGIVGYGGIGAAIAQRARAFGMRTIATKRRPPDDPNLDLHLTPDRLPELLAASDYVVLCVPLTDETVNLIGADELAAMQPRALLINVARGRVLDLDALREALEAERIGGAVLDVAPYEPPDADSPIWSLPRTAVTPHDSGHVPSAFKRTTELFLENLARFSRGEPLQWVVEDTELSVATEGLV